jgi:hypothetical protein
MRREIVVLWLALALGLAVTVYAALGQVQMPVEGQDSHSELTGQLVGNETIGQSFLARYNHLYRVDLFMGAYARPNTHDVIWHLKAAPDAVEDAATGIFNAAQVADYAYHAITFAPLPDSAGRTFYLYLESPASVEGDAIGVWMQPWDLYPAGARWRNGAPAAGDLRFLAYYKGSYRDKAAALLDRLVENKPSFWGDKRLYALLAAMTLGGAAWLLYRTASLFWGEEAR